LKRSKRKALFRLGLLVAVVLAAVGYMLYFLVMNGYLRFNYPSEVAYSVKGIDISHHQGDIDWDALATEDVDFVYIKSTEGGDFKDTKFLEYHKEALDHEMRVGAYHYFSFCKSGKEQAQNFINTVPKSVSALPPAIDLEYDAHCNNDVAPADLVPELLVLIDILTKYYGKSPVIYCNEAVYEKYLVIDEMRDVKFWIRDLYAQPKLSNNKNWTIWQHSSRGTLKGIEGNVDLNVFSGSEELFEEF
jgi:lysozyme